MKFLTPLNIWIIAGFMCFVLFVCVYIVMWTRPTPMFYRRHESPFFVVFKGPFPMYDINATFAYVDKRYNMIVVIVPRDGKVSRNIKSSVLPFSPRSTLMYGSPYEVTVTAKRDRDTLLIFKDGECFRFPLEEGMADELHRASNRNAHKGVLRELAKHYRGDEKPVLEQLVADMETTDTDK